MTCGSVAPKFILGSDNFLASLIEAAQFEVRHSKETFAEFIAAFWFESNHAASL
jgi:hypothetical protein